MEWWMWIVGGLALLAIEVAIPGGVILLFFGAAALVVGGLSAAGLGGPQWFQWALFAVLSIVSLLVLRGPILHRLARDDRSGEVDSLIGVRVEAAESIAPGKRGKVELRGTSWTAENLGTAPVQRGQICLVERADGLILFVREIGS
jgi:membrane protein implicated in regulation of membrane protease activity